jgi:hypothetical protein
MVVLTYRELISKIIKGSKKVRLIVRALLICLLFTDWGTPKVFAERNENHNEEPIASSLWQLPTEEDPLAVKKVRILKNDQWEYRVEFSDKNATQKMKVEPPDEYACGLRFQDLFVLDDGNFATLWKTAAARLWELKVYASINKTVVEVLHSTSECRPEFMYLKGADFEKARLIVPPIEAGHPNTIRNFRRLVQGIVVSHFKMTNHIWSPKFSDVYYWDNKSTRYLNRKGIAWEKRMQWMP